MISGVSRLFSAQISAIHESYLKWWNEIDKFFGRDKKSLEFTTERKRSASNFAQVIHTNCIETSHPL